MKNRTEHREIRIKIKREARGCDIKGLTGEELVSRFAKGLFSRVQGVGFIGAKGNNMDAEGYEQEIKHLQTKNRELMERIDELRRELISAQQHTVKLYCKLDAEEQELQDLARPEQQGDELKKEHRPS